MSVALPIPADAGASSSAEASEFSSLPAEPARMPRAPGGLPEPGKIWRDVYQVKAAVGEMAGARAWRAVRIDTMEDVVLRAVAMSADERRAEVWRVLETIEHPHLLRALTSQPSGNFRVEVHGVAPGESLDVWRARITPDSAMIERLVRAVADALGALHGHGLAHFGVRMKNIFVRDEQGAVDFVLGGLETAAAFEQPGLVTIAVDPLNAPPEAAGLFQHSPGPGLCAWDWWSLGRVVQEVVLGRHVLGHLLQRDVTTVSPEIVARAEALLLERDPGATRAGAVEAMPPMDQRLDLLLRGLLSSARDARWDGEGVAAWLRREPPRELYRLPRNERMFRWRNRAFTVAEAAELLRSAEHRGAAVEHIWEREQPGTLAHFLGDTPAYHALAARLDELRKLETAFALKSLPRAAVREALTAVALLELAGGNLVWCGQNLDEEGFHRIFGSATEGADRLALLQAFTARPVVMLIERSDVAAARVLAEFAHVAATAEAIVRQNRWLTDKDTAGRARLLGTALLSLAALRTAAKAMHDRFACSTQPGAEKLFNLPQPTRPELAALAWLDGDAARYGFLTHEQWAAQEDARLRAAATEEATNLGWLQLAQALARGPWLFARWRWLVPAWLLWAPAALILWPGQRWLPVAFLPLAVGIVLRTIATIFLRRGVRRFLPEARPWGIRDGVARCRAELGEYRAGRALADVRKELDALNVQIGKLRVGATRPPPVPPPPRFTAVWIFVVASWLIFAAGLGAAAWRGKTHRPSWTALQLAWHPPKPVAPADGAAPAEKLAAAKEKDDEASRGPVKVSWPFKPGSEAMVLLVTDSVEAKPEQIRHLAEHGAKLVDPYKPKTINTLIFLRVPTKEKIGIMMYDGATRQMPNLRVYLMDYAPLAKSWVEIAGRQGIFLQE